MMTVADFNPCSKFIAYHRRGSAYSALGQHQRAIEDYDKAIELNPDYAIAYNNRGLSFQELGQASRAREDFDRARLLNRG